MADIKLCKDCKNLRLSSTLDFAKCRVLDQYEIDYVSGKRVLLKDKFCDFTRKPDGACGPEGKLFEQKPRAWYAFWRAV